MIQSFYTLVDDFQKIKEIAIFNIKSVAAFCSILEKNR